MKRSVVLAALSVVSAALPTPAEALGAPALVGGKQDRPGLCFWLGIRYKGLDEGVLVQEVFEGSLAEESSLLVADIIVGIDGTPIKSRHDLHQFLAANNADQRHEFRVLRRHGDEYEQSDVVVGRSPERKPEREPERVREPEPEPPPATAQIDQIQTGASGSPISLQGLKEIAVLVEELTPELSKAGVSRAQLQADVERALEAHGIALREDADPYLYVLISGFEHRDPRGLGTGQFTYAIDLSLRQTVRLTWNPMIEVSGASTWLAMGQMGVRAKKSLEQDMSKIVAEMIGEFLAAYERANADG